MSFASTLRGACASLLISIICLPAAQSVAAILHVPGTHGTLQVAINAAADGDTIVVHGGTHPPFTVTKQLTIMGSPGATIDNTGYGSGGAQTPNITLRGPGGAQSHLTLSGLDLTGSANLTVYSSMGSRIVGGGYDQLCLVRCVLSPSRGTYPTGLYEGAHGISVSVGSLYLWLTGVEGGQGGTDGPWYPPPVPAHSGDGINAPGARVVLLDSFVTGGHGPFFFQPAGAVILGVPSGNQSVAINIPNNPVLTGKTVVIQLHDASACASRPVVASIGP